MRAIIENGWVVSILLPDFTIDDGVKVYQLGRKKSNQLPNGCYARTIHVFASGKVVLYESDRLNSGYSFPSNATVTITQ